MVPVTWKAPAKRLVKAPWTLLNRGISALPYGSLQRLEATTRLAQGKGWGAGTIAAEVQAALSLLPAAARRAPVAFDVGANVGAWTAALLAVAPGADVYCFEPSSEAFESLGKRFTGDVRFHPTKAAVGDQIGTAQLWADKPGSGLGSLSKRRLDHFGIDFCHSENVPLITLDLWQADHPIHPILLKMDVEGHELAVLLGATEVLKSVEVVQFEFGGCNIDSRTYFQDFYYFFRDAGFRLYRLGPKGLRPVNSYSELDEAFVTTNYFAQKL